MKVSYRMHLTNSRPFVRLFGGAAPQAKAQRRDPFELRSTAISMNSGNSDPAVDTPNLLSNRLLILPVFIVIIAGVIMFLGVSWSIRAGHLLLSRVRSLLYAKMP